MVDIRIARAKVRIIKTKEDMMGKAARRASQWKNSIMA